MKVMFDTNIYISFIRNRAHNTELQRRGTTKYLSAVVLMELWAGSRDRRGQGCFINCRNRTWMPVVLSH